MSELRFEMRSQRIGVVVQVVLCEELDGCRESDVETQGQGFGNSRKTGGDGSSSVVQNLP
jgi:hypothetical protein